MLKTRVAELKNKLEARFMTLLPHSEEITLNEAVIYSLKTGGKRLRPILTLLTEEALGSNLSLGLDVACAIEMIHTYSLIHDDLPCMDDDDFRRGKPTLHKVYSEGIATLAGDSLLTLAFQILAENLLLTSEQKIKLISLISKAAGGEGMIAGQCLDILSEGKSIPIAVLERMHRQKTGALIVASVLAGCIVARGSQKEYEDLERFASLLGLAFQIQDDLLDVTAGFDKHGKEGGTDVLKEKATFVSLLGVERAKERLNHVFNQALQALGEHGSKFEILKEFSKQIISPL